MRLLFIQFLLGVLGVFHLNAHSTWSILALDTDSGQIVVSSATCLKQKVFNQLGAKDLRDIQAVVVPGKGVAACQSFIDTTRKNQRLIYDALDKSVAPDLILERLKFDKDFEKRQFGILDMQGRSVGFSGSKNIPEAGAQSGSVGRSIHFQIQGNILANRQVITAAAQAFQLTKGTLSDRVMAAMESADAKGGDRRCTDQRTAYVSYFLAVEKTGKETYISITDNESINPIVDLRKAYNESSLSSQHVK